MIFPRRNKEPKSRGQALVELAFVLPMLCALVLFIMDFGYLMYVMLSLQAATREGVYAGIYDNAYTTTDVQDIMIEADGRQSANTSRHMLRTEITVTYRAAGADTRTTFPTVEISVDHVHHFLVPSLLGNINRSALTTTLHTHVWAIRVPGLVLK